MKRATKRKIKKFLTKGGLELLALIQQTGELATEFVSTPYSKLTISGMHRTNYYRSLRSLKSQNLIQKQRKNYKNVYVLTQKGSKLVQKRFDYRLVKRQDGLSSLIVFDVPEEKSRQRTILRRYLLAHGYMQFQKSVWISPYPVTRELRELLEELRVSQYVKFLLVKLDAADSN